MSSGRVILFGATGYTGHLTAEALARRGVPGTILAGRNAPRLRRLADTLEEAHDWQCEIAEADVSTPVSVNELVDSPQDILISTVGPFTRFGKPAIEAATSTGAVYIDSTGEPPFVRRVFEHYGPRAKRTGASLITAFGYDYVPGNLAGLLAIRAAEADGFIPTRVDVGYFVQKTADTRRLVSGGTLASSLAIMTEPSFAFRNGALATVRPAADVRSFTIDGRQWDALSIGGTENFTLPEVEPRLRDVRVFIGWAGSRTRTVSTVGRILEPFTRLPVLPGMATALAARIAPGSTGGPAPEDRASARTCVVAEAFTGDRRISSVTVTGPSPYDLTADLLAWAADTARRGGLGAGAARRSGALGPVEAFGEDAFVVGASSIGLTATDE
ncbi:MAG: saccharopine dehydrogenase NADP-binding domain-containing protein [Actinobacteria bacterium]|nr:saccharopine dehydrogenase NADP-binding domain-containing protein [Actinomycetota bacterium]MCB9411841.1 saccharopine dehydrogenase NADP-binding domain-containing protein [Actinomycetota bacterium]